MSNVYEDKLEIRELMSRYNDAVDHHAVDDWVALFVEGGVLDLVGTARFEGTEALRTFAGSLRDVYATTPMRHCTGNEVIDVDGDTATGRCYLTVLHAQGDKIDVRLFGVYTDSLRRVDGSWRFVERTFRAEIPELIPAW
jgi:hypothetical protein